MREFYKFCESKGTSKREAVIELAYLIRDFFKKHSLETRRHAWKEITSAEGQKLIREIMNNPTHNMGGFKRLAL